MGDRPRPGGHPHHPHCHRHPPVQEVSAALRTPGDGHLALDSQALQAWCIQAQGSQHQPAPQPRAQREARKSRSSVCACVCLLPACGKEPRLHRAAERASVGVSPSVSGGCERVCLSASKHCPLPASYLQYFSLPQLLDDSSCLGLGRSRPSCRPMCPWTFTWQTSIACLL